MFKSHFPNTEVFGNLHRVLASTGSTYMVKEPCEKGSSVLHIEGQPVCRTFGTSWLSPMFTGSVYHFLELGHCLLLPALSRNISAPLCVFSWRCCLQTSQLQVSSQTWQSSGMEQREGQAGCSHCLVVFGHIKNLLRNVQSKTHYQEPLPLLLPDNIFHCGNSPEDFPEVFCRTEMNLLTQKFTRCINQFRDH